MKHAAPWASLFLLFAGACVADGGPMVADEGPLYDVTALQAAQKPAGERPTNWRQAAELYNQRIDQAIVAARDRRWVGRASSYTFRRADVHGTYGPGVAGAGSAGGYAGSLPSPWKEGPEISGQAV